MEEEYTEEELTDMEDELEDDSEEMKEEEMELSDEMKKLYGSSQEEAKHNQHEFLAKTTLMEEDTEKFTNLTTEEIGKTLFTTRFMADLEDISEHYLKDILLDLEKRYKKETGEIKKFENKIKLYFRNKIRNVTESAMGRDGFIQKMNATQRLETTKRRIRPDAIQNLKGGKGK